SDMFHKVDLNRPMSALRARSLGIVEDSPLGVMVDKFANFMTVPTRALGASDEFFKTIHYRQSIHGHAYSQAASHGLTWQASKEFSEQIMKHTPLKSMKKAAEEARYHTYTKAMGTTTQKLADFVDGLEVAGVKPLRFILPFMRTPATIVKDTIERTP